MTPPVVLITGAASGVGLVVARRFLEGGYRVHVCDVDSAANEALAESTPEIGVSACDIGEAASVDRLFDELGDRYDRLDVLVNNAGIAGPTGRVEDLRVEDWDRTVAVDLNGTFYCTRRAIPLLRKANGASILNTLSNAAFFGFPLRAPYAACKWALMGFTKTLAMELGPAGIRVNAICPGSVEGPRIEAVIERDAAARGTTSEAIRDSYLKQSSMRLFVSPTDVAELAWFLASPAARAISGQIVGVDGHTESLSSSLDD